MRGMFLGVPLLILLVLPLVALVRAVSPEALLLAWRDPLFVPALWVSARTTGISLVIVLATGTPLAWWLAHGKSSWRSLVGVIVDLPVILPPAALGVALLMAFGRQGLVPIGGGLAFTVWAVVLAQVVVAAPFYVQAAANAFREVEAELLIVAETLGATRTGAFFRVAVPVALPGLVAGASLAWARALGEFGATLLFAGNLTGATQTIPLAIYSALERDVRVAVVFSLALAGLGGLLLTALRGLPAAAARVTEP